MKIILSMFVVLFSVKYAFGCAYFGNPEPPLEYLSARTKQIFLGEVLSKTVSEERLNGDRYVVQRIKFKVEKSFKGVNENFVEIKFYEKKRGTSCDEAPPKPEPKEKWIIFEGYSEGNYWQFVREPDWLSFKFDEKSHQDFVARLENYMQNQPTAIYGHVVFDCMLTACDGLKNAPVKISGEYLTRETVSEKDGRFAFVNIPPGKYKLTVSLPDPAMEVFMNWGNKSVNTIAAADGKHRFEYEVSVGFRDAAYYYFAFSDFRQKK